MLISRDKRIQKTIQNILEGIKESADHERTECTARIVPKQSMYILLHVILVDDDIVNEVYTQLQPLLGDIEHEKHTDSIHFKW